MDAKRIIDYIGSAKKRTPVKLYVKEREPVDYGAATVFGTGDKIVFGDWDALEPVLTANREKIEAYVVENDCRNSAIPLLDTKPLSARIEPGGADSRAGGDRHKRGYHDGRDSEYRSRGWRRFHDRHGRGAGRTGCCGKELPHRRRGGAGGRDRADIRCAGSRRGQRACRRERCCHRGRPDRAKCCGGCGCGCDEGRAGKHGGCGLPCPHHQGKGRANNGKDSFGGCPAEPVRRIL